MAKTIKEWKSYYAPLSEEECDTLTGQVARKACIDVQEICGIAEQLQAENARLRTNAGAFVIWSAKFDSVNIKDMREFLEALKGK